jgi:hypothetical protein
VKEWSKSGNEEAAREKMLASLMGKVNEVESRVVAERKDLAENDLQKRLL